MDKNVDPRSKSNQPTSSAPTKIKFSPLHEGMGFHPFSDGLPYAPESKTKYSSGAGATSAGRPTFASPQQTVNQTAKPMGTARQLQKQQITTHSITQRTDLRTATSPAGASVAGPAHFLTLADTLDGTVQARSAMSGIATPTNDTFILRRRAFAYLMDTVIHAGFWLGTNLTALFFFKFQIDSEILKDNFGQFLIFFTVSQWMFIALQEMLFETSIGKVFFNLEFKRNHSSLLLRSMVFMAGVLCLGLGLYFRPQDKLGQLQLKQKIYAS